MTEWCWHVALISAATTVTIHMIFDEAQFRLAEIRGCSNVAEE